MEHERHLVDPRLDNDGDLDLFVVQLCEMLSREIDLGVDFSPHGIGRAYGPPTNFEGNDTYLFRYDGDGRFTTSVDASRLGYRVPLRPIPVCRRQIAQRFATVDLDADLSGGSIWSWPMTPCAIFCSVTSKGRTFRGDRKLMTGLAFDSYLGRPLVEQWVLMLVALSETRRVTVVLRLGISPMR